MTITKASELFSKDERFFPADRFEDGPGTALFAPFPADAIEEEDYAVLEEQDGILADWRISIGGGRLRLRPRWLV
jgi:hypothetical protein